MVVGSVPTQLLLGLYLGLLTGIVPALVGWALGFLFKYFTGVTIPGFGVVVLGLAIAGVNGGLLALNDPTVRTSENSVALLVAIIVVLMLTLYAHAKGDAMGASMPKRLSLRELTERTLSTDVVELVGGRGQVRIVIAGQVQDMEGYPPLPTDLRTELSEAKPTFPADLPLPELEIRVAQYLRKEFDLADVSVRLDERARATVTAAPPTGALSRRVPDGKRAVSIQALVPTGLARGDEVCVETADRQYEGTVVSARSGGSKPGGATVPDGGSSSEGPVPPATPTTTGGDGRVTLAVDRTAAVELLSGTIHRLFVKPRGTRREFELTALLRRAGKRFRSLQIHPDSPVDGSTLAETAVRDTYGVSILAVRSGGTWTIAPGGETTLTAGDELIVVGTRSDLDNFETEAIR